MSRRLDLIGQKFGRLTVLEFAKIRNQRTLWLCQCECGKEIIAEGTKLKNGDIKSCGCLKKIKPNHKIHGLTDTRMYMIWSCIKTRCYNKNNKKYKNYGGRGIKICDEWLNNFQSFYDWAMANGYKDNLTIDRIDVNGDYTPNNCKWATMKEQQNNRSNNHYITYNGETYTMAEWADKLGINYKKLFARFKRGWSVERTLTTP